MFASSAAEEKKLSPKINTERAIHSIKTALACLTGLALTKVAHFAVDQWLIITIAVVMCGQLNVGSLIIKSTMRFLGTLSGSLIAALTIFIFGTNSIVFAFVIALSAMLFSYIATSDSNYSEAGTLGAVTVIIILIGQQVSLLIALYRFLEISAGILIAAIISRFIFPIHARSHLRSMQAKTLFQLHEYYKTSLIENIDETELQDLDETIIKSLSAQRKLGKESRQELIAPQFDAENYIKLLRCEKEIFRGMVCMRYASKSLLAKNISINNLTDVKNFHEQIISALKKISFSLNKKNVAIETALIPSLEPLRLSLLTMRDKLQTEDMIYIDGFIFCAEIIVLQLTQLIILVQRKFAKERI